MHLEYKSIIPSNETYPGNRYDIFEGTFFSDIKLILILILIFF